MSRNLIAANACWVLLLAGAGLSQADEGKSVRKPLGVYAKVDIEDATAGFTGPGNLHSYLRQLYASLLANRAISGLTVGAHWDHIQISDRSFCPLDQPCPSGSDGYDWSYLDDAFEEANLAHKSVQLIITPGVDSPPWLLAKIPSCDGLFASAGTAPADCGQVTFANFPEQQHADCTLLNLPCVFPLPWNSVYKEAWWDFLTHLNARYGPNPAFVSIAVAGPICASTEIILPTTANGSTQEQSGLAADDAWGTLIYNSFPDISSYQCTDQAFIDQWEHTIDAYERIFAGVTLFLSPDAGNDLPEFTQGPTLTVHLDNTLWAKDCNGPTPDDYPRSCEAKTEILSYFITVAGPNFKATRVGGMTAADYVSLGNIGIAGVKLLTSSHPFLGGAEFDHPVSNLGDGVGCTMAEGPGCSISIEAAAYNLLTVFFYGTPAATLYGGTWGSAPIDYLEVPYVDVQYAEMNLCPGPLSNMSLQDLLDGASRDLFEMADHQVPLPPPICN